MIFLAISDLHGQLPIIEEEFDLLMIPGDVCPDIFGKQIEWFNNEFISWVNNLPFKNVWSKLILVPGNHDACFNGNVSEMQILEWEQKTNNHLKILIHESYEFVYPIKDNTDKLLIFGTPYCKRFGTWSFMLDDKDLINKYSQIPKNTDILLSHDSPTFNQIGAVLDKNTVFYNPNAGNEILTNVIKTIKPLIFHSGHMHSGNHDFFYDNGTYYANVSYLDESYTPNYDILKYYFNENTKQIEKLT